MRYFERQRCNSIKENYVLGAPKSVQGTDSLELKIGSGAPLKSLEIAGLTEQNIEPNKIKKHKDYFTNPENYIDGGVTGLYIIPFPDEWIGKKMTFSLVEKTKMTDITFELATSDSFFTNSGERLLDSTGATKEVTSNAYSYFWITGITYENKAEKIIEFWESYDVLVTAELVDFPAPIRSLNDSGMTISINEKTVSIPTSVDINGKTIPLLFSKWDKLTVDHVNNKVIYTMGSWQRTITGKENWQINGWANTNGYGTYYILWTGDYGFQPVNNSAYSNQFTSKKYTHPAFINSVSAIQNEYLIQICTDRETPVEEFKLWLGERYESGNPVILLVKRVTPVKYDITSTELGQALLSMQTPRGSDCILEVKGALSGAPLGCVYYSCEEADMVNITIKYVDENGAEIKEPRINKTRKGSKYLIVAPHIDGYTRVSSEAYGVADTDTEIVLEYRR